MNRSVMTHPESGSPETPGRLHVLAGGKLAPPIDQVVVREFRFVIRQDGPIECSGYESVQ